MKTLTIAIVFLLALGISPVLAQSESQPGDVTAQSGADQSQSDQSGMSGASYQAGQSGQASGSATMDASSIKGSVSSLDQQAESITIKESSSGAERTFKAAKDELQDIKAGDQVSITPKQDDPSSAEKVEKDQQQ
jgi:hypothetical protein